MAEGDEYLKYFFAKESPPNTAARYRKDPKPPHKSLVYYLTFAAVKGCPYTAHIYLDLLLRKQGIHEGKDYVNYACAVDEKLTFKAKQSSALPPDVTPAEDYTSIPLTPSEFTH